MSAEEFLVWGGRGHAKVIRDLLALNQKRVVAVIDNDRDLPSPFNDVDIFYGEDGFRAFFDLRDSKVGAELSLGGVVAIGGVKGIERVFNPSIRDHHKLRNDRKRISSFSECLCWFRRVNRRLLYFELVF